MRAYAESICYGQPSEPIKWVTPVQRLEEGGARYMAHARQQMADGLLDHAGCSLRKAAHKARQAKSWRSVFSSI